MPVTPSSVRAPGRSAIRVLFVLALLMFVAQLVVTDGRREPYPALFLPSFGDGSVTPHGTVVRPEATVLAIYADGSTAHFDDLEVMGQAKSSPRRGFRSAFGPGSPRRSAPATIDWLEHRLYQLGRHHPERAVVEWRDVAYDINGERPPQSTITDRTVISFGAGRG
jgi:hypothetical protein